MLYTNVKISVTYKINTSIDCHYHKASCKDENVSDFLKNRSPNVFWEDFFKRWTSLIYHKITYNYKQTTVK